MYLIDSDILIDYLRLHEPAIEFLDGLEKSEMALSFVTKFEVLKGCRKKINENRAFKLLNKFEILPLNEKVSERAFQVYQNLRWRADIGMSDSMIAATAIQNKCVLISRNVKHFDKVPGIKLKKPY